MNEARLQLIKDVFYGKKIDKFYKEVLEMERVKMADNKQPESLNTTNI